MGLSEWLKSFRVLHEQARKNVLSAGDRLAYTAARDELARAMLAAQHAALGSGSSPRQALRVSRALQADLSFDDGDVRAITLDISAGGFAVLLAKAPSPGEVVTVSLRMPGAEPLKAEASVVEVRRNPGNARVSFQFRDLDDGGRERLELLVFDCVLAQLQS
jgi:hypothetical protein